MVIVKDKVKKVDIRPEHKNGTKGRENSKFNINSGRIEGLIEREEGNTHK